MAKKQPTRQQKYERPNLIVPRSEATAQIKQQIEKGNSILSEITKEPASLLLDTINGYDRLKIAQTEFSKWSGYTKELLKRLFDKNAIAEEYIVVALYASSNDSLSNLSTSMQKRIAKLEEILEKLELIPELTQVPQDEQKGADKKKRRGEKWYQNRTIQAALITGGFMLVAAFVTTPLWIPLVDKMLGSSGNSINIPTTSETSGNFSPALIAGPNSPITVNYGSPELQGTSDTNNVFGKTLLYENLRKRVSDLEHQIIDEKISPWNFLHTGKMKVTDYQGKTIQPGELEFAGTLRNLFWDGFIEPFLENGISEVLNSVAQDCHSINIDKKEFLQEATALLSGLISKTYRRMSEVDKRLRGKGYPEKVTPVDVREKIIKMQIFLDQYAEAVLNDTKPPRKRYD